MTFKIKFTIIYYCENLFSDRGFFSENKKKIRPKLDPIRISEPKKKPSKEKKPLKKVDLPKKYHSPPHLPIVKPPIKPPVAKGKFRFFSN